MMPVSKPDRAGDQSESRNGALSGQSAGGAGWAGPWPSSLIHTPAGPRTSGSYWETLSAYKHRAHNVSEGVGNLLIVQMYLLLCSFNVNRIMFFLSSEMVLGSLTCSHGYLNSVKDEIIKKDKITEAQCCLCLCVCKFTDSSGTVHLVGPLLHYGAPVVWIDFHPSQVTLRENKDRKLITHISIDWYFSFF